MDLTYELMHIVSNYTEELKKQELWVSGIITDFDTFTHDTAGNDHPEYKKIGAGRPKINDQTHIAYTMLITNIALDYLRYTGVDPIIGFNKNTPELHDFVIFSEKIFKIFGIKKLPRQLIRTFISNINGPTYRYKALKCHACRSMHIVKNGLTKARIQKYKCHNCGKHVTQRENPSFHGFNTEI